MSPLFLIYEIDIHTQIAGRIVLVFQRLLCRLVIVGYIALKPVLPLFLLQTAWTVTLTGLIPSSNLTSQELPKIFTPRGVLNDIVGNKL